MLSMFATYSCFYSGLSLATIESQYQCTFSGDQNTGHPITQTSKLLDLLASIYQIGWSCGWSDYSITRQNGLEWL